MDDPTTNDSTTDEQELSEKATNWLVSAVGWFIVGVVVFLAINWLFSTLALAFKVVFWVVIVGAMIVGYLKLRRNTTSHRGATGGSSVAGTSGDHPGR